MKHIEILLLQSLVIVCAPCAAALAQDERALEILKLADTATRTVKACTYDAEFTCEGGFADRLPRISGRFMAREERVGFLKKVFGDEVVRTPAMRATVTLTPVGGKEPEKRLDVATDGRVITFMDLGEKHWMTQDARSGDVLLDTARQLYMLEFFHPTPFADEIGGLGQAYEGQQDVGGVKCDVVYVKYRQMGLEARWYFGANDHLPRRVDRVFPLGMITGVRTLSISNLNTRPEIRSCDFRPACPENFTKRQLSQSLNRDLLARGTQAPNWELPTSDGRMLKLSDLRGQVVVMSFWATWCDFCKQSMPAVQKVRDACTDKPVKFIAVHCWDPNGDPLAFLKARKLSFDAVVRGDKIAESYKVSGLPTYYVIDADGKIIFGATGANQLADLAKVIEGALEQHGK
ncbi:MAG: redoxin domain-containing protein [Phycisphaerae bacterium]|nr:redoxin domain-containing protein [Phycisphaerae bacterium]